MNRRLLIRILLASFCAHAAVFWPLPVSQIRLPVPREVLQARLIPAAVPDDVAVIVPSVAPAAGTSGSASIESKQPKNVLPDPRGQKGGSQGSPVLPDRILRVTKEKAPSVAHGEIMANEQNLQVYKFALASAALDVRPSKGHEPALQGTAVVDIHLAGTSARPLVVLADSSGVDIVDALALQMIRLAVGRVAAPPLGEGVSGVVRLSVVFELESP